MISIFSTSAYATFTLDPNGVTIHCDADAVGATGVVGGVTYTKIDVKEKLSLYHGYIDATQACTSGVTNMFGWFDSQYYFNKDISHWDTSKVTYMDKMFYLARVFNQPIGSWDTSKVTTVNSMFYNANAFNQPIGNWDTSKVINMQGMCYHASAFNQNISTWCVSLISSEPFFFDGSSGFENNTAFQPTWGTCPIVFDSDATLTSASTITEPIPLPSTADTSAKAVGLFDFSISDGGSADVMSTDVTQIVIHTSGTADFTKVTWRLNGADATNVVGNYSSGTNTLTFSSLSISVADGASETYTISGYFSNRYGLTDNATYIFSVDGDTDLTLDSAKTQMGATTPVTNGTGTKVDITATKLRFETQPANELRNLE
jgi:surface protein